VKYLREWLTLLEKVGKGVKTFETTHNIISQHLTLHTPRRLNHDRRLCLLI
jgi:hypothetical protein